MLRYQLEILSVCPTLAGPNEHSLSYCFLFFFFPLFHLDRLQPQWKDGMLLLYLCDTCVQYYSNCGWFFQTALQLASEMKVELCEVAKF